MKRINTMAAFLKVDATKRWGDETSPIASPAEDAALELQEMVRKVNLQHKPISVARFLDLAYFIRELVIAFAETPKGELLGWIPLPEVPR